MAKATAGRFTPSRSRPPAPARCCRRGSQQVHPLLERRAAVISVGPSRPARLATSHRWRIAVGQHRSRRLTVAGEDRNTPVDLDVTPRVSQSGSPWSARIATMMNPRCRSSRETSTSPPRPARISTSPRGAARRATGRQRRPTAASEDLNDTEFIEDGRTPSAGPPGSARITTGSTPPRSWATARAQRRPVAAGEDRNEHRYTTVIHIEDRHRPIVAGEDRNGWLAKLDPKWIALQRRPVVAGEDRNNLIPRYGGQLG